MITTIERIELVTLAGRPEIRIDWDNDRHQSIMLHGADPESVISALIYAAHLVEKEKHAGYI